jgi:ferritin-like protein
MAVLDAERTSMRTHQALYEQTRDRDPITARLVLDLLTEATRGEQQLQRLLRHSAAEMDGI